MTDTRPTSSALGPLAFLRRAPREVTAIDGILDTYRRMYPKGKTTLIERAYQVAEKAHRGQQRKSGEPYIIHPIAVAQIIAEMGLPESVICAALLHDVVEDTSYPLETLREEFGDEVAEFVDGVTKARQGQVRRCGAGRDGPQDGRRDGEGHPSPAPRLADRLHNARTWEHVPVESARRKAQETLEIYAPLAHRMGLNAIKWELEDLSFKTLYPKIYGEIVDVVAERAPEREKYLTEIRTEIAAELRQMKIKGEITGRPKHYYSVYQKMIVRGRDLADIYDLVGVRILVETVRDCYAVLGAMHARYQPVPGRFKDYIAMPKFNLYQSLHTTVIGPSGKPVELQIRTQEMHRRAEYGLASHWRYKETVKGAGGGKSDDMGWLRQIADWQQETADPTEFLDSLRGEISRAEVYVFTPRGRLLALPQGATPIDFAYAVHTEVGHKTIGAKVNGRLVPLDSTLENGDTVEVLTTSDQNAHPKRDWLDFAQSTRARNKIRQWFTRERREESIETGRDMLARAIRRQHLPMQRLMSKSTLLALAKEMHYEDVDGLYAAIGEHKEQASDVVSRMVEAVGGDEGADEDVTEITRPGTSAQRARRGDVGVSVHGLSDVVVKAREVLYAGARRPHPWVRDPRQWRLGASRGLRESRLLDTQAERFIDVQWTGQSDATFLVQIEVEALDRNRLLSDVVKALSDYHVNILGANVSTNRDRVALNTFTFEMADPSHLGAVLSAIRRIDGVYDARRITGAKRPL
ncbi:RelA/SpoT family protein [Demequina litorisediminis]|uniref:GTP pyrophosphokinase n=1 Tax=Demequina litorisediminis TaxID=1849022 RepID=A0ABQ6IIK1_9MICO|nr:bifunctional (p)ppGpp synthetase/guanosine-3',5'-bis(diphosphate) 3'-pyrophosphohydrolase [Demequina litorisediminis]GMA37748.1 GTP pyrophosphokinase [Demequina litorisediminis]